MIIQSLKDGQDGWGIKKVNDLRMEKLGLVRIHKCIGCGAEQYLHKSKVKECIPEDEEGPNCGDILVCILSGGVQSKGSVENE